MKKNILVLHVFAFLLTTSLGNAAGLLEINADDEAEEVLPSTRPDQEGQEQDSHQGGLNVFQGKNWGVEKENLSRSSLEIGNLLRDANQQRAAKKATLERCKREYEQHLENLGSDAEQTQEAKRAQEEAAQAHSRIHAVIEHTIAPRYLQWLKQRDQLLAQQSKQLDMSFYERWVARRAKK